MKLQTLTVHSMIDEQTFRDFSYFHNLTLGNRKAGFLAGSVLLIFLAFLNLFTGSTPLFAICLGLALGVPGCYFLFYQRSLKNQIRANHLETPREAYTLTIDSAGVTASSGSEQMTYPWDRIFRVYRTPGYIYIYIIKNRAFILPLKDITGATPDALWELISSHTRRTRIFS